ncbi:MAG: hypothetical protein JWP63_2705 [Candidatus Solibacter sp.]|nr:hypothetical protein [Candidatus Solibacter sp.]
MLKTGQWLLCFLAISSSALAQTAGTIVGRITDASQAAAAQAKVELVNQETGITATAAVSSEGDYIFQRVTPGNYRLTATSAGFKTFVRRDIPILVNQTARVDVQLEVGAIANSIEVDAQAPMIQTDNTSVGSVVDGEQIEAMPLNGRTDIYGLLALAPGVQGAGSNPAIAGSAFRGGTGATIDGVSNDDAIGERLLGQMPSLDSVAEFKVISNGAPAEFGKSAQIVIASKGGSNTVHGGLFAFNRNAVGAARTHSVRNLAKPAYNRNEYGGSISGPIKKNKLFYTGSFEGLRLVQSSVSQLTMPKTQMKTGDLSLYLPTVIKDPLSGLPFAGNIIPTNRISATSQAFFRFFPDPNTPGTGTQGLGTDFATNVPQHQPNDRYSTRIDYQASDKDSITGRYFWTNNGPYPTAGGGLPFGNWDGFGISTRNLSAQYTRVLSPTFANVFRLGLNYWTDYRTPQNHDFDPSKYVPGLTPPLDGLGGAPTIAISGFNTISDQPGSDDHNHVRQFIDHLTWQHAKHSIKVGIEYNQVAVVNRQNSTPYRGSFSFDGRYSGNAFADFLLGDLSASGRATGNFVLDDNNTRVAAFAQDDWRITRNLTLNLGLRYDYESPWHKNNELAIWDRDLNALAVISGKADPLWNGVVPLVDAKSIGKDSGNYMNFGKRNFSPRAGLAYRPFTRKAFVIRSAYGIFYNIMGEYDGAVDLRDLGLNPPFRATQNFLGSNNGVPNLTWADAFAGTGTSSTGTPPNLYAVDKNFKLGYNQQWNVTMEWEPIHNTSLRASYVGSKATHFVQVVNLNDPLPSALPIQPRRQYQPWGNIFYYESNRNQLFNQLQLGAIRRFKSGLKFQAEYQFSRALGGPYDGSVPTTYTNLRLDRGNGTQYVRHYMVFNYNYDLPIGRGKRLLGGIRGPLDKILSGWQLAGIGTVATGSFLSVTFNSNKTGWNSGRADIVSSNFTLDNRNQNQWFNTAAFAMPAAYTFGNSAPNLLQGPGRYNLDSGLFKSTKLSERVSLAVRAEAFNVFNHANLGNPGTNVSTPSTFGFATGRNGSRITQLGARLSF